MGRQCAPVDPPFPRRISNLHLLLDRLGFGDRLLKVFQRQIELIGVVSRARETDCGSM
jgi:hypothetical protein